MIMRNVVLNRILENIRYSFRVVMHNRYRIIRYVLHGAAGPDALFLENAPETARSKRFILAPFIVYIHGSLIFNCKYVSVHEFVLILLLADTRQKRENKMERESDHNL